MIYSIPSLQLETYFITNTLMPENLLIEYYTPDLSAPHAYSIRLKVENETNKLKTDFVLNFLDRDTCTEYEILQEGYTGNDDLKWHGSLNLSWLETLKEITENINLSSEESNNNIYISISDDENLIKNGYTHNKEIEYFLQEMHQAILEAAQQELPLTIHVKEINSQNIDIDITCIASFLERKAVFILDSESKPVEKEMDWTKLKQFLEIIYSCEFDPDLAIENLSGQEGLFIEIGDDIWYPVNYEAKDFIKSKLIGFMESV